MRFGLINWRVFWLALSALTCAPLGGDAQPNPNPGCGSELGSVVQGVVVNDSTDVPVSRALIYLFVQGRCSTYAGPLGRFILEGVPPGDLRIEASAGGYRQFFPITLEAAAGDTTHVELRLVPGGPLEDCRALAECAPLTEVPFQPLSSDPAVSFRVTALGTAIGLAWPTVGVPEPWYACFDEESSDVLESLAERFPLIVGAGECELPVDELGRRARQMRHIGSNRPAFRPRVEQVETVSPGRRTVALSFYVGPLWAAGWDCDFVSTDQGWRPTLCRSTWVS